MITIHTVTIIEKTRADYRRTLTELFLSEAPGAAGIPTKYEYNVETDNAGNIIYLNVESSGKCKISKYFYKTRFLGLKTLIFCAVYH